MVLNRVSVSLLALAMFVSGEAGAQGRGRGAAPADSLRPRVDSMAARLRALLDGLDYSVLSARPGFLPYGLALECSNCRKTTFVLDSSALFRLRADSALRRVYRDTTFRLRVDTGRMMRMPLYTYSEWPMVAALAPGGVAERAGVLVGDTLVAVNGQSILTPEGARQFATVRPGQDVTLTLRRAGRTLDVTVTLAVPEGRGARGGRGRGAPPSDLGALPLRFAGQVGATPVEVMSDAPLTAEMDPSGDLVIHVAGATVRVRPTGAGGRRGR